MKMPNSVKVSAQMALRSSSLPTCRPDDLQRLNLGARIDGFQQRLEPRADRGPVLLALGRQANRDIAR